MADIRHHMEHSYYKGSRERARQAVADALLVIRQLLVEALREDPRNALGSECWTALLENADLFEAELQTCRATLETVDWETEAAARALPDFACPSCRSALIRQRDPANTSQQKAVLICSACGKEAELGPVLSQAFDETFGGEAHIAVKDGGEPPISTCPECSEAACDFALPEDAACAVCGTGLSAEEYYEHDGLCSYHAHIASKDD